MSNINNNGFNPNKDVNVQKMSSFKGAASANESAHVEMQQQTDASSPVTESQGRSQVRVDNHDADMQRLLKNPQLAEVSDKMFNAACRAGIAYPEAATFATLDS